MNVPKKFKTKLEEGDINPKRIAKTVFVMGVEGGEVELNLGTLRKVSDKILFAFEANLNDRGCYRLRFLEQLKRSGWEYTDYAWNPKEKKLIKILSNGKIAVMILLYQ